MKTKHIPIKAWISYLTGSEEDFTIEHRLFNLIGFFAGLIGGLTVIINLLVKSQLNLMLLSVVVAIFCWSVFYFTRFKGRFKTGRFVLTIFMFAVFTYLFFINNGSRGPILHLYLVFFLLLLFIWNGNSRLVISGLFVLNITVFFFVEMNYPELIKPYEEESQRIVDIFLSFYLYIILGGVILLFAKKSYEIEKIKAQKSDNLKSAFLANMSHEIRTPMNAILGFTQLLHRDLTIEKKEAFLKIITDNSHSLLRIIEDIIDISKIEAGELSIIESECNLNVLFQEIGFTYSETLKKYPEREVEIKLELPEQKNYILADTSRLRQVIVNLFSNSIKYTEKGTIRAGYTIEGDWLRIFVKDTGLGIQEEHISEIFDRFRKIETEESMKVQPGTGIGLSISKNLIRMMGGKIGVDSIYGEGSEFYFTIPYKPSFRIPLKLEEPSALNAIENVSLFGKIILIAEDEDANFHFLKRVIERTGAKTLRARNGKEAVEIFTQNKEVDLVLMDIMMPEMNGYEASEAIKKINSSVPIIAQTALAMEGDSEKVLSSGCDDYLSKPIRIKELLRAIQLQLNRNVEAAS